MNVVDVEVETVIARPVAEVAAYAGNPDNAPDWYANISSIEWLTDPPIHVGSEVAFVARFLGRTLAYTYRVVELVEGERLVMETGQGPFPMRTTYTWEPVTWGTRMTLRNTGSASRFGKLTAPVVGAAVKRATAKDLARLKAVLER